MDEEVRFILHTTRPGYAPAAVAFTKEATAMSHTLTATRSGEFERVVLMRDLGIAHQVIYDSSHDPVQAPTITVERDEVRAGKGAPAKAGKDKGGKKGPAAPIDWRARADKFITYGLILIVVLFAVDRAFNR